MHTPCRRNCLTPLLIFVEKIRGTQNTLTVKMVDSHHRSMTGLPAPRSARIDEARRAGQY